MPTRSLLISQKYTHDTMYQKRPRYSTHTHTHTCTHTHVHTHTRMYTHTHACTHTHALARNQSCCVCVVHVDCWQPFYLHAADVVCKSVMYCCNRRRHPPGRASRKLDMPCLLGACWELVINFFLLNIIMGVAVVDPRGRVIKPASGACFSQTSSQVVLGPVQGNAMDYNKVSMTSSIPY